MGTVIPQFETSFLIAEGLKILSTWNPSWQPIYFMTDNSYAELEAIAEIFPSCIRLFMNSCSYIYR